MAKDKPSSQAVTNCGGKEIGTPETTNSCACTCKNEQTEGSLKCLDKSKSDSNEVK